MDSTRVPNTDRIDVHTFLSLQTHSYTQLQVHATCVPCDVLLINFITSHNFMSFLAGCYHKRFSISVKQTVMQVLSVYIYIYIYIYQL